MLVSAEQEVEASTKQEYAKMMAEAQKKNALDRDAAQGAARVKAIATGLISQTAVFQPGHPEMGLGGPCADPERGERLVHAGRQDGHV